MSLTVLWPLTPSASVERELPADAAAEFGGPHTAHEKQPQKSGKGEVDSSLSNDYQRNAGQSRTPLGPQRGKLLSLVAWRGSHSHP